MYGFYTTRIIPRILRIILQCITIMNQSIVRASNQHWSNQHASGYCAGDPIVMSQKFKRGDEIQHILRQTKSINTFKCTKYLCARDCHIWGMFLDTTNITFKSIPYLVALELYLIRKYLIMDLLTIQLSHIFVIGINSVSICLFWYIRKYILLYMIIFFYYEQILVL